MRIARIEIEKWRNLREVILDVPADARLICLVGANGTGKSNVLELLSFAAYQFGLSTALSVRRPTITESDYHFRVVLTTTERAEWPWDSSHPWSQLTAAWSG